MKFNEYCFKKSVMNRLCSYYTQKMLSISTKLKLSPLTNTSKNNKGGEKRSSSIGPFDV